MNCCVNCFGDSWLESYINSLTDKLGTCSFCDSSHIKVVEPNSLKDYFELLLGIYVLDEHGQQLDICLSEDWRLFQHPKLDSSRIRVLLGEILDDGELVRKKFSPSDLCNTNSLSDWQNFREEITHGNRFFPSISINRDRLNELLGHLAHEIKHTDYWFRARINNSDNDYPLDRMGAPPKVMASNGRANPAGIPYLYLASSEKTAVSEVRAQPGDKVQVAKFKVQKNLNVVDLRNPRKKVSPFILEDENQIATLRGDVIFLEKLGLELSVPVISALSSISYVPSQFLCEFIKKSGFDGVLYKSAIGDGCSLALFDIMIAHPVTSRNFKVSRIDLEVEEL